MVILCVVFLLCFCAGGVTQASISPSFSTCFSIFFVWKDDKVSKDIQLKLSFYDLYYIYFAIKSKYFFSPAFPSLFESGKATVSSAFTPQGGERKAWDEENN